MSAARPTVAIVGAGLAGAASALALSKAGARVTLIDRFEAGHALGSSHGGTRLFRTAYFERPDYVPLLLHAFEGWKAIERAAGVRLFHDVGLIEAGPADGVVVPGVREAARLHSLDVAPLSRAEAAAKGVSLAPDAEALFETRAGFLLAEASLAVMLRLAAGLGAEIRRGERALGWAPSQGAIRLRTDRGWVDADRLVLCPGAYANELLGPEVPRIAPAGKTLLWFRPQSGGFRVSDGFAPFGVETREGAFFYGFPAIDDDGVKVGEHMGVTPGATPDTARAKPHAADADAICAFVRDALPGLDPAPAKSSVCLYEMSPDGDFIIDRHPLDGRVVLALGLSGHGFKFGPAIGRIVADLVLERPTLFDARFLSLARFGRPPAGAA